MPWKEVERSKEECGGRKLYRFRTTRYVGEMYGAVLTNAHDTMIFFLLILRT
jgi:hypothetical protein